MKDGGPAFPVPDREVAETTMTMADGRVIDLHSDGMTLRQWYAGKALQGLAARITDERYSDLLNEIAGGLHEAAVADTLASAMILYEERESK